MKESLGITPHSKKPNNEEHSTENKNEYEDIICTSYASYFPFYYLGRLKEIYIDKLDYLVGMKEFETLFNELNVLGVELLLLVLTFYLSAYIQK